VQHIPCAAPTSAPAGTSSTHAYISTPRCPCPCTTGDQGQVLSRHRGCCSRQVRPMDGAALQCNGCHHPHGPVHQVGGKGGRGEGEGASGASWCFWCFSASCQAIGRAHAALVLAGCCAAARNAATGAVAVVTAGMQACAVTCPWCQPGY
jgi:hypothetical protein